MYVLVESREALVAQRADVRQHVVMDHDVTSQFLRVVEGAVTVLQNKTICHEIKPFVIENHVAAKLVAGYPSLKPGVNPFVGGGYDSSA